ncbi:cyclase family protein [soil metagenome]
MGHRAWSDDEIVALYARVNNAGRWGRDDELGTLNYITPEKRRAAATLVQTGRTISLALPLAPGTDGKAGAFLDHTMDYGRGALATSAGDRIALNVHQPAATHLDCVSHLAGYDGRVYNDRRFDDVAQPGGLTHGSVFAQREGIFTRGVLLDLPAAQRVGHLPPAHAVTAAELDAAEINAGVRLTTGDALIVRVGAALLDRGGRSDLRPGPGPDAVEWMHQREVALYGGDAADHIGQIAASLFGRERPPDEPEDPPTRVPLPVHQIGIPAMGLVLLDQCAVEELAAACAELRRYEFLFVAAPLPIPGGTGSPVNPLAVF